jgi:uncharacterized protein
MRASASKDFVPIFDRSLKMYSRTIPNIIHGLKSLSALLSKAEEHCTTRKIEPDALLHFRLFPDMFPLSRQVQIATDFAKGCGGRLSSGQAPSFADTEKTFAELRERIAKTIVYLETIKSSALDGAEGRSLVVRVGRDQEQTMQGEDYYNRMVLPNFYFHIATVYNILRHNGLDVGKGDYLGRGL